MFEIKMQGDLADQFESEASHRCETFIHDHYGVASSEELSKQQVDEIWQYCQSDACWEYYVRLSLETICTNWTEAQV